MIPELDLFMPRGKSQGDAWFPSEMRGKRLRILKRLIMFYEKNRHDGIADGMIWRIRLFLNILKKISHVYQF